MVPFAGNAITTADLFLRNTLYITGLASSMAANTLATGMIVFRIVKVMVGVQVKPTSIERNLGSTGGAKFRHIMFVLIESAMALFAIQLVRVVLIMLVSFSHMIMPIEEIFLLPTVGSFVIAINQMLNVIIIKRSVHTYLSDNIYLARALHQR